MKIINKFFVIISVLLSACLYSCGDPNAETTTSGNITIAADESFTPIIDTELQTFTYQYKSAKIKPIYLPEEKAISYFMKDSARLVFATRELYDDEIKKLEQNKIFARTSHAATDAIALIVNPANPDSMLSMKQIEAMLSGKTTQWNQISSKNSQKEIVMVFDNNESSNLSFMNQFFKINNNKAKIYAAGSNAKVIDYVKNNPNAIGIIGTCWISDKDDPKMLSFLDGISVVGISKKDKPQGYQDYFQPYQAYIATGDYALTRKLYIISREPKTGLGTGFSAFITSDKGQRIILKSGIYPANAPIRILKIKNEE